MTKINLVRAAIYTNNAIEHFLKMKIHSFWALKMTNSIIFSLIDEKWAEKKRRQETLFFIMH